MASLTEDIDSSAEWISRALTQSGYRADFTPGSLWEIDRFFEEQSTPGMAKAGGLLAQDLGQRLFAIGAYMGEVVRRSTSGEWVVDDESAGGEISVELRLENDVRCWPVQRAMKRFQHGSEDGIAVWGMGMGLHVGAAPEQRRKGLWGRLFE